MADIDVALDELDRWAKKYSVAYDPVVVSIAGARTDPVAALYWSKQSMADVLPLPTSKVDALLQLGRLLTVVRNVAVFAPIVVTWYAIWEVSAASEVRSDSEVSFIEFWQSGGSGGDEFLSLSDVAMLAAWTVIGVAAITLIAAACIAIGRTRQQKALRPVMRERSDVAHSVGKALLPKAAATGDSVFDAVQAAVVNLGALTSQAVDATNRLAAVAQSFDHFAPVAESLTDRLVLIGSSVDALVSRVDHLDASVGTNAATVSGLFRALSDTRDILETAMAALAETAGMVRDDLDVVSLALHQKGG